MTAEAGCVPAPLPAAAGAALAAYFLVTVGSSLGGDLRLLLGVPLTLAGLLAAVLAAVRAGRSDRSPAVPWITGWLSVLAAVGLLTSSAGSSLWYDILFHGYFAVAIVLIGVFTAGSRAWQRRTTRALLLAAFAIQVLTPLAIHPVIDVWSWTESCTRALLHGIHPYTVRAPDLQHGAWDYGSTPPLYPYMPAVVLASAPSLALLGDYRFGLALCLPVAVMLLRSIGKKMQLDPWLVDAMSLALVLHPRSFEMTAQGFTEPYLVLALAAFVWCSVYRPGGYGEAIAFFLLPSLKQYVAAPTFMYAANRKHLPPVLAGITIAAVTVVPFLVWNWRSTIDGVLYLVRAPIGFRFDSDSLAAEVAAATGVEWSRSVAIFTQMIVGAVAYLKLSRYGVAGLLLASGIALLASFLVATQAFPNYYYFDGAVLIFAAAMLSRHA